MRIKSHMSSIKLISKNIRGTIAIVSQRGNKRVVRFHNSFEAFFTDYTVIERVDDACKVGDTLSQTKDPLLLLMRPSFPRSEILSVKPKLLFQLHYISNFMMPLHVCAH